MSLPPLPVNSVPSGTDGLVTKAGVLLFVLVLGCHSAGAATAEKSSGAMSSEAPERAGLPKSDPKLEALVREGSAAFQNKNYDLAISRFTAALQMIHDKKTAGFIHHLRADAHLRRKDLNNAMRDANEAVNLFPRFSGGYLMRGITYLSRREYDKAISDFDTALQLNPYSVTVHYYRAATYGAKGDHQHAILDSNEAIRRNPKAANAYNLRGADYAAIGKWDKAMADYDEAIRQDPSDGYGFCNRGDLHAKKGNYREAASDMAIALRKSPNDDSVLNAVAWFKATCPEASLRNGKEAVRAALQACALTKWKDSNTMDTLAAAYAEVGDFDQAVKYQTQVVGMKDPDAKTRKEEEQRLPLYRDHKPYREQPQTALKEKK